MALYTLSQTGAGADMSLAQHNADSVGLAAGDVIASTGTITGNLIPPVSGTLGSEIIYRDLVINGGGLINQAITFSDRSHIIMQDFEIQQAVQQGLFIAGGNITNLRFLNGIVDDIPGDASAVGNGVGIIVNNVAVTSLPVSNILFKSIIASNCGRMGFDTQTTGHDIFWDSCTATLCGGNYDGGGFYAHPYRFTRSTGWTLVSGTIYSTPALSINDDVTKVFDPASSVFLTRIGGTTPAVGEYHYSFASGLIINTGANPNGTSIQYSRGPQSRFYWLNCNAYGNLVETSTLTHGTGLQVDDLVSDSFVYGGEFYNNEGAGLQLFRGQRNVICGALVHNNASNGNSASNNGIQANQQVDSKICNFASRDNFGDGVSCGSGNVDIYNGITQDNEDYGIESIVGASTATKVWNYNNGIGATKLTSGGTLALTDAVETDPELQADDTFLPTAPVIGVGVKWWTGANPGGYGGDPLSDFDTDAGHIQSTFSPFHPKNL